MPGREIPLITGETYHVLNRAITSQPAFLNARDYRRADTSIPYYQNASPPLKFSKFLNLTLNGRAVLLQQLKEQNTLLVEIIAYCLMPNHFHLLLRQNIDDGISIFTSKLTNSYTRYFNTKYERKGPIFQGKFKAIRVENEGQILHLSRYIHLNPLTAGVVRNAKNLLDYQYASFPEYVESENAGFCQKDIILSQFESPTAYQDFVLDRADYQRSLWEIGHLALEN